MQKATHEQARNEMIRSGNDVDLVVQRYRACMRRGGGEGVSLIHLDRKEFMKDVVNLINLKKIVQFLNCYFMSF